MHQTPHELPQLTSVCLLPFIQKQEDIHFLLSHQVYRYSLIGGPMVDQDELNPLLCAFRLLSEKYSDLLNLASFYQEPHPELQRNYISKWLLESVSQVPRVVASHKMVLPLKIASHLQTHEIEEIVDKSCHRVSLVTLNQLSKTTCPHTSSLLQLVSQKILLTSKDNNYFGLLNCSYPLEPARNPDFTSLCLIGSLLNESDIWKNFSAPQKQLPSVGDIQQRRLKGVAITGSICASYDKDDWIINLRSFLKSLSTHKEIKMLGTCFGHQILALSLGGSVGPIAMAGFIKKQEQINFKSAFCSLPFLTAQTFKQEMVLQELHGDEIKSLPADYQLYASSGTCKYECVGRGNQILSSQFHPEYTRALVRKRFLPRFQGCLSKDEFNELLEQHVGQPDNWRFRQIQYAFLHSE